MLYLKPLNREDCQKEYEFFKNTPSENGFVNDYDNTSYEDFVNIDISKRLNSANGINVPNGLVPDTYYFLWDDEHIVGIFKIRHYLNAALRSGAGHIGYAITPSERRKGYAEKGLQLAIEECKKILPPEETEIYLSCRRDNEGSLKTMLKNGAYIHHSDNAEHYTRIKIR